MNAYASRTGSARNLAALRRRGWRLMISAAGRLRDEGFPYALDNGAWHAYQQHRLGRRASPVLDLVLFAVALARFGARADFVVLPDLVAAGLASLALSLEWMPRVLDATERALVPVQDGMVTSDVRGYLGPRVGIFVGGGHRVEACHAAGVGRARARGRLLPARRPGEHGAPDRALFLRRRRLVRRVERQQVFRQPAAPGRCAAPAQHGGRVMLFVSAKATVCRSYTFEAAHHLPQMPEGHRCRRVHGHSWGVEVLITGSPDDRGIVVDFDLLDLAWAQLHHELDHRDLNEIDGLQAMPTCEVVARWILVRILQPRRGPDRDQSPAERLADWVNNHADQIEVRVSESPGAWAGVACVTG